METHTGDAQPNADAPEPPEGGRGATRRRLLALASAALVGAAVAVPLWALSASGPAPSRAVARPAVRGCASRSAAALARRRLRSAEQRYGNESGGARIHLDLRQIAHDARLTGALRAGNVAGALAAANGELVRHVVQIRILRGSHVVLDANPTSFDVAGSSLMLRGPGGRSLGTLQITIQDIIGFIKLEGRLDHTDILVRGAAGQMRTSLPGAAALALPDSGCVRVGPRRYVVASFHRLSYTGQPLTIWVLVRA